jgi:transketolase
LLLTRQNVPVIDPSCGVAEGVERGAYVVSCAPENKVDLILIGTGSEVSIALEAQKLLAAKGVSARVVSMPCWERFAQQPQAYQDSVLPPGVTARIAIEAGVTTGWQKWVGSHGIVMGIDHFGASAPYQQIYQQFGLTPEHMVQQALALLGQA